MHSTIVFFMLCMEMLIYVFLNIHISTALIVGKSIIFISGTLIESNAQEMVYLMTDYMMM